MSVNQSSHNPDINQFIQPITLLDVMARLGQERQRASFHLQDSTEEMAQQWQRGFLFALDITLDLLKKLKYYEDCKTDCN